MAEMTTKRHPIRAALYGLMLGFSIWYFLQFEFASFALDSTSGVITKAVVVIGATVLLAVVWAYVAPPRKPKGAPAPEAAAVSAPEPVSTAVEEAGETEQTGETGETGADPTLPSEDE